MSQLHPESKQPQTGYFYLPSLNGRPAEIIQVLNCISSSILIPVPEEDIELNSFFKRDMTEAEIIKFGERSVWNIFTSWLQLETDHRRYGVSSDTMALLLRSKATKILLKHYIEVA